jgi:hypothetical protein
LVKKIFEFDDFLVATGIVLFFLGFAVSLGWLVLRSPWRDGLKKLCHGTSDLIMLLSLLFSLMIGFLASEIENRNDKAASAVGAEGNALQSLASILRASAPAASRLRQPAADYLGEVLKTEFSGVRQAIAASTASVKLADLFDEAIAFSAAHGEAGATPSLILEQVVKASEARAQRLALMQSGVNELKWWLVCFLLLALQVSIVLVNFEQPRKMLIVLALVSLAGSVTVAAAALQEDPFTPPRMVSVSPLELVLTSLAPVPVPK